MWQWDWLVGKITEFAHRLRWEVCADIAITFVVGPVLAWRFVKYRRQALLAFFSYVFFLFAVIPIMGGTTFLGSSILWAAFVTLFGFGGYAVFMVGLTAYNIVLDYVAGGQPSPGIAPAIPGVRIGGVYIPFFEGIVAFIIALLVHEGAHGVVAIRERIPIRAGGVISVGLLPIGAYVEPDEGAFRGATPLSRARVLSAGPVANLFVFALFSMLLILAFPVSNYLSSYSCDISSGVRILDVPRSLDVAGATIESPAYSVLAPGDVIQEINGSPVRCVSQFFEVLAPLREAEANTALELTVLRDGGPLKTVINTERGYIGVVGLENSYAEPLPPWFYALSFVISLLSWVAFLNLMVGLVNMLPIPPLDGGHIYKDILEEAGMHSAYRFIFLLTLAILVINVLPWFI